MRRVIDCIYFSVAFVVLSPTDVVAQEHDRADASSDASFLDSIATYRARAPQWNGDCPEWTNDAVDRAAVDPWPGLINILMHESYEGDPRAALCMGDLRAFQRGEAREVYYWLYLARANGGDVASRLSNIGAALDEPTRMRTEAAVGRALKLVWRLDVRSSE